MSTMHYVTALAMPKGASELPKFRTDMAKFPNEQDARKHAEMIRGPAFIEVRVEPREESVGKS